MGSKIDRIVVPKASDILARQIRDRILAGEFGEGELLPNERDLADHSGLSRTSVRDALRVLEFEGLILTRPGRNGGSAVRRPSRESFERSVSLFIWGQQISFEELLETRIAIEPQAARFAALHRTDDDLAHMRAIQQQLEDAEEDVNAFRAANVAWHAAVVKASQNKLLVSFYRAIMECVHVATNLEGFHSPAVRRQVINIHDKVLTAIAERDGDAAARRMHRHVDAYTVKARGWAASTLHHTDDTDVQQEGDTSTIVAPTTELRSPRKHARKKV
ncbi:FadR family transcriptional regulator [Azospirillum sp. YIM B02556]|uniref:FadR family transcriptional regulator n=1 Tax=Azospirillum endophyticum TaxID=2800326 RepID=A0ABS1EZD9_9PROT|nr:FadR/GntR family transcriptional regulator [Azospirillum endophyticum]MBK1836540.1 FadR family transcriptional regulator [Azospirillum endophyticum]